MWTETRHNDRWDRHDGAAVKIDHTVECDTSRPWLPNYRGWAAWGPGEHELLTYQRKNSRFHITRKFKTAQNAMKAVDKQFPLQPTGQNPTETGRLSKADQPHKAPQEKDKGKKTEPQMRAKV